MRVLVLNPGSVTLKATVLDTPERAPRFDRTVDWAADPSPEGRERTIREILGAMAGAGVEPRSLEAVGYRVVHGGRRFRRPVLLDDRAVAEIAELSTIAPLHNPLAVATIRAARHALPGLPHVAAFDTAFHATLPEEERRYPVPERWTAEWGIRRYGFHGLSVEWSTGRAAELLGATDEPGTTAPAGVRLVVAHLGGGCSVTAVDAGRSVATSMGLTPLEGLMMGSRAGSIDPGILLRLLQHGRRSVDELEDDLDHRSGLVGVAGTADMRRLTELAAAGDARAGLAIRMFVSSAAAGIAAAATRLRGLDAIVFTGGIGANAATVRAAIVDRLGVLGVAPLPTTAPPGADAVVSADASRPAVLRIEAREDLVIARDTAALVRPADREGTATPVP